jgi:hypothetical protein
MLDGDLREKQKMGVMKQNAKPTKGEEEETQGAIEVSEVAEISSTPESPYPGQCRARVVIKHPVTIHTPHHGIIDGTKKPLFTPSPAPTLSQTPRSSELIATERQYGADITPTEKQACFDGEQDVNEDARTALDGGDALDGLATPSDHAALDVIVAETPRTTETSSASYGSPADHVEYALDGEPKRLDYNEAAPTTLTMASYQAVGRKGKSPREAEFVTAIPGGAVLSRQHHSGRSMLSSRGMQQNKVPFVIEHFHPQTIGGDNGSGGGGGTGVEMSTNTGYTSANGVSDSGGDSDDDGPVHCMVMGTSFGNGLVVGCTRQQVLVWARQPSGAWNLTSSERVLDGVVGAVYLVEHDTKVAVVGSFATTHVRMFSVANLGGEWVDVAQRSDNDPSHCSALLDSDLIAVATWSETSNDIAVLKYRLPVDGAPGTCTTLISHNSTQPLSSMQRVMGYNEDASLIIGVRVIGCLSISVGVGRKLGFSSMFCSYIVHLKDYLSPTLHIWVFPLWALVAFHPPSFRTCPLCGTDAILIVFVRVCGSSCVCCLF